MNIDGVITISHNAQNQNFTGGTRTLSVWDALSKKNVCCNFLQDEVSAGFLSDISDWEGGFSL